MENEIGFIGKKIFFLYPHSVIRDDLLKLIIQTEYEVYLVKEHKKMPTLLARYPESILFINIDEGLKEAEWEAYVKNILSNPETQSTKIGILSYGSDQEVIKKYLMELMVPCGFIKLKLGLAESTKIILKTLEANEARGRRKFVRVKCNDNNKGLFNVSVRDKIVTGQIQDISSVGMACKFDDASVEISRNVLLKNIQLRLKGNICMVNGVVYGIREQDDNKIYVILFNKDIPSISKDKIHDFIYHALQNDIDFELKKIVVT